MGKKVNKIGIYVPESRLQEITEYRDEMNFSEVFWRAFDAEKKKVAMRRAVTARMVIGNARADIVDRSGNVVFAIGAFVGLSHDPASDDHSVCSMVEVNVPANIKHGVFEFENAKIADGAKPVVVPSFNVKCIEPCGVMDNPFSVAKKD